jgi:hypothetical protein
MLSVIMLNVVVLSVVMLNIVAPYKGTPLLVGSTPCPQMLDQRLKVTNNLAYCDTDLSTHAKVFIVHFLSCKLRKKSLYD